MADKNPSLMRSLHHLRKGGLHRALGIESGTEIPKEKIAAATHSKNEHVARMARFAQTMSHFKH
jgi:DNA-binding transcriptional regulator YdaS (Cro superfamily)